MATICFAQDAMAKKKIKIDGFSVSNTGDTTWNYKDCNSCGAKYSTKKSQKKTIESDPCRTLREDLEASEKEKLRLETELASSQHNNQVLGVSNTQLRSQTDSLKNRVHDLEKRKQRISLVHITVRDIAEPIFACLLGRWTACHRGFLGDNNSSNPTAATSGSPHNSNNPSNPGGN